MKDKLTTMIIRFCGNLTEFETAAATSGWQQFLLPGSDEAASPQVSAMLAEVRHVIDGAAFDTALRVSVHWCRWWGHLTSH